MYFEIFRRVWGCGPLPPLDPQLVKQITSPSGPAPDTTISPLKFANANVRISPSNFPEDTLLGVPLVPEAMVSPSPGAISAST